MFHWICPECGCEISPHIRECPSCDPNAVLPAPPSTRILPKTSEAVAAEVQVITNKAASKVEKGNLRVLEPPVQSPIRQLLADPVSDDSLLPVLFRPQDGLQDGLAAILSSLEDVAPESAKLPDPPSSDHLPIPVSAIPSAMRALIDELKPAAESPNPEISVPSAPSTVAVLEPPLVETRFPISWSVAARDAVARLESPVALPTVPGRPTTRSTPRPDFTPELAPLVHYSPLKNRPMKPANSAVALRQTDRSSSSTIPGPMLTPNLRRFNDRGLNPIPANPRLYQRRHRPLVPTWLLAVLMTGTLLGAGFGTFYKVVPKSALSDAKAVANRITSLASNSNPLSKLIEVTGIRIVIDPGRKSEIQYVVVNHSSARFPDVNVYVTLRSADARAGQPPLCRFSFASPHLGPFESKEMSASIEKLSTPLDLPDWQDVKAEIEIGQ